VLVLHFGFDLILLKEEVVAAAFSQMAQSDRVLRHGPSTMHPMTREKTHHGMNLISVSKGRFVDAVPKMTFATE